MIFHVQILQTCFIRYILMDLPNEDGSVNWLPGAASVEGILANTAVFEKYGNRAAS